MVKPVININEAPTRVQKKGSRYEARLARLGALAGMKELGAQYVVVPAGKTAYPKHNHHNNEEIFVILEGTGDYQRGDEIWPVRAGDVIAAPAGFADTAHQLRNTSGAELKYLAISTRHDPDIMEYPDSQKFFVASGTPPDKGMLSSRFVFMGRDRTSLDYWDGEDIGDGQ